MTVLHIMQAKFLPECSGEKFAYTTAALISSLGLYKQQLPAATAAGVMDDAILGMEQACCCMPVVYNQIYHGLWKCHTCVPQYAKACQHNAFVT